MFASERKIISLLQFWLTEV